MTGRAAKVSESEGGDSAYSLSLVGPRFHVRPQSGDVLDSMDEHDLWRDNDADFVGTDHGFLLGSTVGGLKIKCPIITRWRITRC